MSTKKKPDADEWIGPGELAAWFGVTRQAVYAWSKKGQGPPFVPFGNRRRYRVRDVEQWVEEKYKETAS